MKRLLSIAALLMLILASAAAQKTLVVNGTARTYLEYVPSGLGSKPALLISCHGASQDAAYQKNMLKIESTADREKFITVFPNGIDHMWDITGDRDINYLLALIDKMAEDYDIDRNRVYLSGFSMGGMLTYHAMTKIADKIAAFAPISGYPIYGATFVSKRPIPIIHTHGTADDVCTYDKVQGILDGWIKRDGCNTTPVVTKSYGGYSHVTRKEWTGGTNGVKVVLMELAGKGHWVSNDGIYTGEEIWKFCKNYSLEQKGPKVSITYPRADEPAANAFTATADVTDEDGTVTRVSFYIDNALKGRATEAPYSCAIKNVADGTHTLVVQALDDKGYKGTATMTVTVDGKTGIQSVTPAADAATATAVYDLGGKKVSDTTKGNIYIINNKKILKQ